MLVPEIKLEVGKVDVVSTNNTGLTVEYWADQLLKRIIHVADDSEAPIKAQAEAFRDEIGIVVRHYMRCAIKSDRTTIYNDLLRQGQKDLAEIIRREI